MPCPRELPDAEGEIAAQNAARPHAAEEADHEGGEEGLGRRIRRQVEARGDAQAPHGAADHRAEEAAEGCGHEASGVGAGAPEVPEGPLLRHQGSTGAKPWRTVFSVTTFGSQNWTR